MVYDPTRKRRPGAPPSALDNTVIPATPPAKAAQETAPESTAGRIANRVRANAQALRGGINAVQNFLRQQPGVPASQRLGERLAASSNKAYQAETAKNTPAITGDGLGAPAMPKPATPITLTGVAAPAAAGSALSAQDKGAQQTADWWAHGGGIPSQPPATAPAAPGANTGVTLPGGRHLNYGAMVNGVPTFSDGSGGGGIPRTVSNETIQSLGERLPTVPDAAFTNPIPAFNSDNSEANIANIIRSRQGGKFGITPEMRADANLAEVINQDPRSTLGRAALNASRRAAGATTTMQRKAALGNLDDLVKAVATNSTQRPADAAATERANITGANDLARTGLAGQYDLAGIRDRNRGDLAKTDLAGQYDVAAAREAAQSRAALTDKDLATEAANLVAKQPSMFGLTVNGQIEDPKAPGGLRNPSQAELAELMRRAGSIIRASLQPQPAQAPAQPTLEGFISAARQQGSQMSDTQLKQAFQQRYGS